MIGDEEVDGNMWLGSWKKERERDAAERELVGGCQIELLFL